MNRILTRREFLKVGATGLISVTFAPLLGSCSFASSPAVQEGAKKVVDYVIEFAVLVGLKKASETVEEWIQGLDESSRQTVDDTNTKMAEAGFTNYKTPVYYNNTVIFYGVENQDQFNACVPFYSAEGIPLVEGPALMGIALSGKDWSSSSVSAADGLIPLKAYQDDGSQFEVSFPKPFQYKTNAGTLSMTYEADTNNKKGLISVVATDNNGGVLHGQDHVISWV